MDKARVNEVCTNYLNKSVICCIWHMFGAICGWKRAKLHCNCVRCRWKWKWWWQWRWIVRWRRLAHVNIGKIAREVCANTAQHTHNAHKYQSIKQIPRIKTPFNQYSNCEYFQRKLRLQMFANFIIQEICLSCSPILL